MMLEKDPSLSQLDVESILKTTALPLGAGSMTVFDLYDWTTGTFALGVYSYSWGAGATGSGLVQADFALDATPTP